MVGYLNHHSPYSSMHFHVAIFFSTSNVRWINSQNFFKRKTGNVKTEFKTFISMNNEPVIVVLCDMTAKYFLIKLL